MKPSVPDVDFSRIAHSIQYEQELSGAPHGQQRLRFFDTDATYTDYFSEALHGTFQRACGEVTSHPHRHDLLPIYLVTPDVALERPYGLSVSMASEGRRRMLNDRLLGHVRGAWF